MGLVFGYAVGAATVGISWSRYLVKFFEGFNVHLPMELVTGPWDGESSIFRLYLLLC